MSKESTDIEILKADLQLKADLKTIGDARYGQFREVLDKLPANRMMNAINYIDANLLPAIKRKSGDKSPDFLFFVDLIEMLQWSIVLYDRMKLLQGMNASVRLDLEMMRDRVLMYEEELQKYTTLEDIWLSDAMKHVEKGVRARMEATLRAKKK